MMRHEGTKARRHAGKAKQNPRADASESSSLRASVPSCLRASAIDLPRLRRSIKPFRLHHFNRLRSTNNHAATLRKSRKLFAPAIVLTSTVVVLGYALMFLIAARTAGVTAPPSRVLPLALLAMAAMVLPSVAGWGPREGATAWVFGAAGLGASLGVSTAVVYGVMALVASLPGALVLIAAWAPRRLLMLGEPRSAADA